MLWCDHFILCIYNSLKLPVNILMIRLSITAVCILDLSKSIQQYNLVCRVALLSFISNHIHTKQNWIHVRISRGRWKESFPSPCRTTINCVPFPPQLRPYLFHFPTELRPNLFHFPAELRPRSTRSFLWGPKLLFKKTDLKQKQVKKLVFYPNFTPLNIVLQ